MKKIRSSIVAILLILSVTLVVINLGTIAAGPETESGARASRLTDLDFHWMNRLGVISEPVPGQDNNINYSSAPAIAVEGDHVYVVWMDDIDSPGIGNDFDILYRFFDGSTWSPIEIISEPAMGGSDDNDMDSMWPDIAVENGEVYIVWMDGTNYLGSGTDSDIFYRHYDGSSWQDIQVISEHIVGTLNDQSSDAPSIDVENGDIYVVWHDKSDWNGANTADFDIFYTCNLTGTSWEYPLVISEPADAVPYGNINTGNSYHPCIDVDNGDIYVVWQDNDDTLSASSSVVSHDIFYRCNLTGTSFENVQVISEPVYNEDRNEGQSQYPRIAVESDNIYVVWHDDNDTLNAGTGDDDIFYICNLTTGTGWEDVQVINEPIYGTDTNKLDSRYPDIVVENSVVYIAWQDYNESLKSGTDDDIFFMYNDTAGTGEWSNLYAVSEPVPGADFNTGGGWKFEWPRIDVNLGKIHIVWEDDNATASSGTDWDIHYRKTFVAPTLSAGSIIPTSGNTSTVFNYTVTYMDPDNEAPAMMNVKIDGVDHAMLPVVPGDTNYLNGKDYYFASPIGIGAGHIYAFWASDGRYIRSIGPFDNPDVINTAPNITTADVDAIDEDVFYEVIYEYDDMDRVNVGQIGTWTCLTDADWLVFNGTYNTTAGTAMLNGTPTNDDTGDFWVNITIDDGIDSDYTNFTLTVNPINDPPVILTDILPNATEEMFYEFQFTGEDVDSTTLYWNILTNASWLNVNITAATINGTPTNAMVGGEYWVHVTLEDGLLTDMKNFTLEVENVNDLPVITTNDITVAYIDELYEVDYEATDDDAMHGDMFTWYLFTDAGWLEFNTTTGVLSGSPNATHLGSYYVNVTVEDNFGGTDFHNFTLMVEEPPILNLPPFINNSDVKTATVNESYYVKYLGGDDRTTPENLTWSMKTNAGSWLKFNASSRELHGVPGDGDVGLYWVNITVMDEDGAIGWTNFTLNVTKPTGPGPGDNHAPVLTNGSMSPASGDEDTSFTFTVHYTDEDGDPPASIYVVIDGVEYPMDLKPGDNASDGDYIFVTKLPKGNHTYYFKASDGTDDAVPGDNTPTTSDDAATTPEIQKGEEDDDKEADSSWMLWLAIIIIVIIILAILAFAMMKRKPAAEAPPEEAEEEEELAEWEEDEEGEDEWEEDEDEEGEEDEDEWEEDEDEEGEDEEDEEFEDEVEEEAEEDEDEWEEEEENEEVEEDEEELEEDVEDLPPVKSIDCPKCKSEIEIPFSEDAKVGLECPSCGAKGKISNPYME